MNILALITVCTNLAYISAFDDATRNPAWVAYDLEPCEIVITNRDSFSFRADPRLHDSNNADDYAKSGYDRGHLAPAADFNFDRNALAETYLYSNVCPMLPSVNRGEWAEIEAEVRRLAKSSNDTVHVLTWPEYHYAVFGTNLMGRVHVPFSFHKVAWGKFGARHWVVFNFKLGGECRSVGKTHNKKEGTK